MNDTQNICLSCGLCCDGTLIGFVQLEPEEVPRLTELMEIEQANGVGLFLHPCDKYCDACTIYEQRPKRCANFECGLLKSVDQNELSFDEAVETVKAVKIQKAKIEEKLPLLPFKLESPSFYFQIAEVYKWLQNNKAASSTQNLQDLISDLEQLDKLLIRRFGVTMK